MFDRKEDYNESWNLTNVPREIGSQNSSFFQVCKVKKRHLALSISKDNESFQAWEESEATDLCILYQWLQKLSSCQVPQLYSTVLTATYFWLLTPFLCVYCFSPTWGGPRKPPYFWDMSVFSAFMASVWSCPPWPTLAPVVSLLNVTK